MSYSLVVRAMLVIATLLVAAPAGAQEQDQAPPQKALDSWRDFIHYSRIAQNELAQGHGQALLNMDLTDEQWLRVVESGRYADEYPQDLQRMANMEGPLAPIARNVAERIEQAKLSVIRQSRRIRSEIQRLDDGLRAYRNAVDRLRIAGEYAAPELVAVLTGQAENAAQLRPYVLRAIVDIGRPLVVPLAEIIDSLGAESQQDVARSLAAIGYPVAMPYLKELLETADLAEQTRRVVQDSYNRIAESRRINPDIAAGRLFFLLAEDYYAARPSLILQPEASQNLVWYVNDSGELRYTPVPTEIFTEVRAMQAARRALTLDADQPRALSLWLAANFRRENQLPPGKTDPTYGERMQSPAYYARMAGPTHIKHVLGRAVETRDAALALDAVDALGKVAGTQSMIDSPDAIVASLNYPDRRVRFETAFAVARANPAEPFAGSARVIPILSEAVAQSQRPNVLVLAEDQQTLNKVAARVREAGDFDVLAAASLAAASELLADEAAADLIVVQSDLALLNALRVQRGEDYKIQTAPVVAVVPVGRRGAAQQMFADQVGVVAVDENVADQALHEAMDAAVEATRSIAMDEATAERYATRSLSLLRDLAINRSRVFDVALAEAALIEALNDERPAVVAGAARVLALIESQPAQQAIAGAALDAARPVEQRVTLFDALAESAQRWGTQLTERQQTQVVRAVRGADGELADAAARAYGALNQPAATTVELIPE